MSVAAPFVWRCPSTQAMAPFSHPAHRTGHADRSYPRAFSALIHCIADTLAQLPNVTLAKRPRLADFAELRSALALAVGGHVYARVGRQSGSGIRTGDKCLPCRCRGGGFLGPKSSRLQRYGGGAVRQTSIRIRRKRKQTTHPSRHVRPAETSRAGVEGARHRRDVDGTRQCGQSDRHPLCCTAPSTVKLLRTCSDTQAVTGGTRIGTVNVVNVVNVINVFQSCWTFAARWVRWTTKAKDDTQTYAKRNRSDLTFTTFTLFTPPATTIGHGTNHQQTRHASVPART